MFHTNLLKVLEGEKATEGSVKTNSPRSAKCQRECSTRPVNQWKFREAASVWKGTGESPSGALFMVSGVWHCSGPQNDENGDLVGVTHFVQLEGTDLECHHRSVNSQGCHSDVYCSNCNIGKAGTTSILRPGSKRCMQSVKPRRPFQAWKTQVVLPPRRPRATNAPYGKAGLPCSVGHRYGAQSQDTRLEATSWCHYE